MTRTPWFFLQTSTMLYNRSHHSRSQTPHNPSLQKHLPQNENRSRLHRSGQFRCHPWTVDPTHHRRSMKNSCPLLHSPFFLSAKLQQKTPKQKKKTSAVPNLRPTKRPRRTPSFHWQNDCQATESLHRLPAVQAHWTRLPWCLQQRRASCVCWWTEGFFILRKSSFSVVALRVFEELVVWFQAFIQRFFYG